MEGQKEIFQKRLNRLRRFLDFLSNERARDFCTKSPEIAVLRFIAWDSGVSHFFLLRYEIFFKIFASAEAFLSTNWS